MCPTGSELIRISAILGAGRGVVTSRSISKDTIVLRSERPAAHVIFREYRKEVCAQCFFYDRGRTLSVRHNATGKVFCTPCCEGEWLNEQGELGLASWESLHNFVQSKSKAINNRSVPLLEDKPDSHSVEAAWAKASDVWERSQVLGMNAKTSHRRRTQSVDPDILSYLLSGVLFCYRHPDKWHKDILDLAMDQRPYRDRLDLEAHCNGFLQLAALLPHPLLPNFTSQLCQNLTGTTSHNSFGIRSGSEDGEEYMGYALYPEASYFNHSCSPNIAKKRVGAVWEFRALRDIEEGEQCCITYLGGDEEDLTMAARRARLRVHWGFQCMCERCLQEDDA